MCRGLHTQHAGPLEIAGTKRNGNREYSGAGFVGNRRCVGSSGRETVRPVRRRSPKKQLRMEVRSGTECLRRGPSLRERKANGGSGRCAMAVFRLLSMRTRYRPVGAGTIFRWATAKDSSTIHRTSEQKKCDPQSRVAFFVSVWVSGRERYASRRLF